MAKRRNKSRPVPTVGDADERILTTEELTRRLPLNRVTIWRMVREGRFPPPVQLTTSRIGWRWSAVLAWLAEREQNPDRRRAFFGRNGADSPDRPPPP